MRKRIFAGLALAIAASNAHAQETIDVSKITCEQYALFQVADPQYIAIWLDGYYNGKRANMIVDVSQLRSNAEKLMRHCELNVKDTVVEAVGKLFGPKGD